VESLQVGIRARWSRVRAPTTHSYSTARNSHIIVLAQTGRPSWPRVWEDPGEQIGGGMLEPLKRTPPLPYHLGFMVGLASGVPPSVNNMVEIVYQLILPALYNNNQAFYYACSIS
jgi:hypothetical protein